MANGIDLTQLNNALMEQLERYAHVVAADAEEAAKKVSKKSMEKLKTTSPVGYTGDYAKGWRVKKVGQNYVIHNATDYQLTHLLEKGHALRNGGRTQAQPHIKPVEQRAIRDFEELVRQAVQGN